MEHNRISSDALVVGAGISGISTALELAETGFSVTLVERNPYVGGRVAQLNEYFPKLCPPTCGLEINTRRLRDNARITLLTLANVDRVSGRAGDFTVNVTVKPRYVKDGCPETEMEKCVAACDAMRKNDFDFGLRDTKALFVPFNNAYPMKYVFDKDACSEEEAQRLAREFSDCIDLDQEDQNLEVKTKAIVWATGWKPYDATKLDNLGYQEYDAVITNMEMERLAAPSGPTQGKIQIPGSQKEIGSVAFVQCAGSRDENHLPYCSAICCLASMKQAQYVRRQYPESDVHIFYIDLRAHGTLEEFYQETKKDEKIQFHRGKVAKVEADTNSDQLIVTAEDTLSGRKIDQAVDLVVLATGMEPNKTGLEELDQKLVDTEGFIRPSVEDGMGSCGVCRQPKDVAGVVQEATGAALEAIHVIKGIQNNG